MKSKNIWLYILVGGAAYYFIYKYWKNKSEKNFYGFVDEEIAQDYGGGNRGKGMPVQPRPSDEPVYTKRGKGRA